MDRVELKRRLMALKGSRCQICRYDRCEQALTFHHIDPASKAFNIAGSHHRGWDVLVAEVEKCVLVCANCHREIEFGVIAIPTELVAAAGRVADPLPQRLLHTPPSRRHRMNARE